MPSLKRGTKIGLSCVNYKMRFIFKFLFCWGLMPFLTGSVLAQSVLIPLSQDYYHIIDRYEIKKGKMFDKKFSAVRPFYRKVTAENALDILKADDLSKADKFNLKYLINDSWEWSDTNLHVSKKPVFKHFYKAKPDLYHVDIPEFNLHVNPVLYFGYGFDERAPGNHFINTRGVELRGIIDKKVGFYTFIGENQINFPEYVNTYIDSFDVVPNEGFWKVFNENGVDFFTARGYITFNATKHINFQLGHDRHFVGNGYRSLILSDFAPAYFFLKINTRVWKINYTNIFASLTSDIEAVSTGTGGTRAFNRKNMALHHLSIDIGKKVNIGLFESVIFARQDSLGNNQFDASYLNPIIFYRAIEQQNGSPDNALLGMDFKWHAFPGVMTYGQFIFDEFLLEELQQSRGWWGNKFGFQAGAEWVDALKVKNLDLQFETNWVRPYTYSHNTNFGSYSHYRQPLAHPLGANFREFITAIRYQPVPRLFLQSKLFIISTGRDTGNLNFGSNILLNSETRNNGTNEPDFGNDLLQGVKTEIIFWELSATYQFKHNLFFDLRYVYREERSEIEERSNTTNFPSFALRFNIPQRLNEF